MDIFNIIDKYCKMMKEEKKYNYKYKPILTPKKKKLFVNKADKTKIKTNYSPEKEELKKIFSEEFLGSLNNIFNNKKPSKIKATSFSNKINDINIHLKQFHGELPTLSNSNKILLESQKDNDLIANDDLIQIYKAKKNKKINKNDKHYFIKNHCPFCKNLLMENNKRKKEMLDPNIEYFTNIYRNKNFKDIKSSFIYSVNNFPLLHFKDNKNFNDDSESEIRNNYFKTQKLWRTKNIDMESDYTKSKKLVKFFEIQRKEFDPSDLYLVKKPLIPTIRGKILKNTKKRFGRPMRIIITGKNYEENNNNSKNNNNKNNKEEINNDCGVRNSNSVE